MRLSHAIRQLACGDDKTELVAYAKRGDFCALHRCGTIGYDRPPVVVGGEKTKCIWAGGDPRRMPAIDLDQRSDRGRIGSQTELFECVIENLSSHALLKQSSASSEDNLVSVFCAQMRLNRCKTAEGEVTLEIERVVKVEDKDARRFPAR